MDNSAFHPGIRRPVFWLSGDPGTWPPPPAPLLLPLAAFPGHPGFCLACLPAPCLAYDDGALVPGLRNMNSALLSQGQAAWVALARVVSAFCACGLRDRAPHRLRSLNPDFWVRSGRRTF